MGQRGIFDFYNHQEKLQTKYKDPLSELNKFIDWEAFHPIIVAHHPIVDRNKGGRPPFDKLLMFKILVLQDLYNLSDEQAEYQIMDRSSFLRFLGLEHGDRVPDQNTIWHFREQLTTSGCLDALFEAFNTRIEAAGLITKKGSVVDASFVTAPIQRNSRKENETLKQGNVPQEWSKKKKSHKDTDAKWTKKNNETKFGYKNHIKTDKDSKLITNFETTSAEVHDSQVLDELMDDEKDAFKPLWADSAYKSEETEKKLADRKIKSEIHEKGARNNPLTEEQKETNRKKSSVRAQVEHVFGWMHRMGGEMKIKVIGLERATAKITVKNLTYNMVRSIHLVKSQGIIAYQL